MAQKGLTQHIPLVIWIDKEICCERKRSALCGFPSGSGPAFLSGKMDHGRPAKGPRPVERIKSEDT